MPKFTAFETGEEFELPEEEITTYGQHKQRWNACQKCGYCKTRKNVVLLRGSIPCDVLFIGEAPGDSENVLGKPFVGPAGKYLELLLRWAKDALSKTYGISADPKMAFTNLVACRPTGEDTNEPSKEAIKACRERLIEVVHICKPTTIVRVGKLSTKYLAGIEFLSRDGSKRFPWVTSDSLEIEFFDIIHPAAIMRMNQFQRPLAIQQTVVTLSDAITPYGPSNENE